MEDKDTVPHFKSWAILELMGHRRRAGLVEEVELGGAKMLRIDIPIGADKTITEFYGGSSVYGLRPCSEEMARDVASDTLGDEMPVRPAYYAEREARKRLQPPERREDDDADEPFTDDGEDDNG